MARRRHTRIRTGWGNDDRYAGRRTRRVASRGGIWASFIHGVRALWATPATRSGRRRKISRRRS